MRRTRVGGALRRPDPFGEQTALEPNPGLAAHDAGGDEGMGVGVRARERLAPVVPQLDRFTRRQAAKPRAPDVELVVVDPGMPGAKAPLLALLEIERCHGRRLYATLTGSPAPAAPAGLIIGKDAMSSPAPHRNRLAAQTSPYLLQHADNPVDWYPWGPEALERARGRTAPFSFRSATPPATGAMSWPTSRSRMRRPRR